MTEPAVGSSSSSSLLESKQQALKDSPGRIDTKPTTALWLAEDTRLFLTSLLAHLQCYPDSSRQNQIVFLLSVFPDRGEAAIRMKIESEFRKWSKREQDPTPELNDLRHALFKTTLMTSSGSGNFNTAAATATTSSSSSAKRHVTLIGDDDHSHSNSGNSSGDDEDDADQRADKKGMAEPWGEAETSQFLVLLKEYQTQHPNQRRIDKIRHLVKHFPNRTDKAIAMKINHEKRRLMGTLRDPFPQLNHLRESVYKLADNSSSSSIGGKHLRHSNNGNQESMAKTLENGQNFIHQSQLRSALTKSDHHHHHSNDSNSNSSSNNNTTHHQEDLMEMNVIRELKRIQEDLKRQRNETKLLTDYVSSIAQEVRQVRSQLHVLGEK